VNGLVLLVVSCWVLAAFAIGFIVGRIITRRNGQVPA
jgi:hypothetical protein